MIWLFNAFLAVSGNKFVKAGEWDSIHVVEVRNENSSKAHYKLTTTVMLNMGVDNSQVGDTNMCGSLTRQVCYCWNVPYMHG
jgi:hypothetical protein